MEKPALYQKNPVIIQAMQWTGSNLFEIITFIEGKCPDLQTVQMQDARCVGVLSENRHGKWSEY